MANARARATSPRSAVSHQYRAIAGSCAPAPDRRPAWAARAARAGLPASTTLRRSTVAVNRPAGWRWVGHGWEEEPTRWRRPGAPAAAHRRAMPPRREDEMGCLLVLFGGLFPRLAVLILWIARPERVDAAFSTLHLAAAGHHLPALRDPDLSAVVYPGSGAEWLGLVSGSCWPRCWTSGTGGPAPPSATLYPAGAPRKPRSSRAGVTIALMGRRFERVNADPLGSSPDAGGLE